MNIYLSFKDPINISLIFIGSFFLVLFLSRFFITFLNKSKFLSRNKSIQAFLKKLIKRFAWPSYFLLAFYVALSYITTGTKLSKTLNSVFAIISTVLFLYLVQNILLFFLEVFINKNKKDNPGILNTLNFSKVMIKFLIWLIGILLILSSLGYNINSLVTGLGIGGIAIALAVQNILGDLLNSFSIIFDKPFNIGDFIIVGNELGTVEHIGIKTTRIRALHGELIIIPNTDLVKSRVQNYKQMQRRRVVVNIGVTYQTSSAGLKKAKEIITKTVTNMEGVTFDRANFSNFGDSSLDFEFVFYIETGDYNVFMDKKEEILLSIKSEFEKNSIEFAYPTQTIHMTR